METVKADCLVIGAGPGGYAAAWAAAERGRRVQLIEHTPRLGGVCLHHGCIPSKALLHATALIREAKGLSSKRGIEFGEPTIKLETLRAWIQSIVERLEQGIRSVSRSKGIELIVGRARWVDASTLQVDTPTGPQRFSYQQAILAVGSRPTLPRTLAVRDPRIMTSTEALACDEIPRDLLVVGGGYIGLELGTVYATLGSRVVLVEAMPSVLPGVDLDLVRPLLRATQRLFTAIHCDTRVVAMERVGEQITVVCEGLGGTTSAVYDRVLVAVGRVPNTDALGLEHTQVTTDAQGFVTVNAMQQTSDPAIYAIGDIVGGPLLAHKAHHEARVAVEALTGHARAQMTRVIPAVIFTDPEVAWCGLTETAANAAGIPVRVVRFPWAASGRAVSMDRPDGLTKLLIEPSTERILGVGMVGAGAGELISEGALAMEVGATARTLADVIHPHPTLSETLMECAERFYSAPTRLAAR